MVFYRERNEDRPPLSQILPNLYLGAEADVTQDCLTSQGISYVLSVSRCCPQPTFLPQSQYLRIPIDDSLRDELLPWIPEALQFIDGAMSLGCSVLVHCAAGVSRSPAMAVAYVMYRLGLGLDDAYRFVKERRPSISPNFNFLGQLQSFQGTLAQKGSKANTNLELIPAPDACLLSANKDSGYSPAVPLSGSQDTHIQDIPKDNYFLTNGCSEETKIHVHCDGSSDMDNLNQGDLYPGCTNKNETKNAVVTANSKQDKQNFSGLTLSLSDKLRTLTLTLNPREIQNPCEILNLDQNSVHNKPKSTQQQISPGPISLSDKRRSLTLSLSPVGVHSQNLQNRGLEIKCNKSSNQKSQTKSLKTVPKREPDTSNGNKRLNKRSPPRVLSVPSRDPSGDMGKQYGKHTQQSRETKSTPKTHKKEVKEGCSCTVPQTVEEHDNANAKSEPGGDIRPPNTSIIQHRMAPEKQCAVAVEAVEGLDVEQTLLSPLSLTVNKLLGWGERMLLGALLGPRVRVGQAALPYRC